MAYIETRTTDNGDTRYRVQVKLRGFPRQSATFTKKRAALRWAQKTEEAIREGRYFKTAEAKKHTFDEMIDRYIADVLPHRASDQKKTEALLKHWKREFGPLTLDRVTRAVIVEERDRLAREKINRKKKDGRKKRRSPGAVNRYTQALSHVYTVAIHDWEWCTENRAARLKLKEPKGRTRWLGQYDEPDSKDDGEMKRLLKACKASVDRRLYPLVILALWTGARAGELLKLCWKDIDFEREIAILWNTKNTEHRSVPITGHALEVLRDLKRVRRLGVDEVFAHPKTGKARFPQKPWERARVAAQIEDFRFHDLRHSAASYLLMEAGCTLVEVGEVLGHKSPQVTARYAHLAESHVHGKVAAMNQAVFEKVSEQ